MATNYLSGIIDELDPQQKLKNTGYGGNIVEAQGKPAIEPIKSEIAGPDLGAEPGGFAGPAAGGQNMPPILEDKPKAIGTPERDSVGQAIDKARGFLVGFDTNKLNDPNKLPGESGKYTPAAKAFSKISQTIGVGRGQLGQAVGEAQRMGFPDARAVGDDKIDFGDGNGPIDVVRSDGQLVFQNTTGNPQYEAAYAAKNGGGGAPGASGAGGGGSFNSLLNGNTSDSINAALAQYQQPDLLKRLIEQLQQGTGV